MRLSEEEWRAKLTPEQYRILREKGTEIPFSGKLLNENRDGSFMCAACGVELFRSDAKYESTTPGLLGWPSFSDAIHNEAIEFKNDTSLGTQRVEVVCKNCGSHLGHVFDEKTSKSGKHYCINSVCLAFDPKKAR